MEIRVDYAPPGPVARDFIKSDAFVRGIMGPVGSGKSVASAMTCFARSMNQRPDRNGIRRVRGAIIRNSYPELKTTTIKTWLDWFPHTLGHWRDQGPPAHTIKLDGLEMEVLFLALDTPADVKKLLSLELTWGWINEAREVPKAVLDGLTGRVGRFPSAKDGAGCTDPFIVMDTNPPDTDHWWFKLAEKEKPEGFAFFRQPPGNSATAENLQWLNQSEESLKLAPNDPARREQGRKYYERITAGKGQDWINVYVMGEYGFITAGRPVYPEYRDGTHCKEVEPWPDLPIYLGMDFGLTPAAIIGQRGPMGQWRWLDELVASDLGAKNFAAEVKRWLNDKWQGYEVAKMTGDPAGASRSQTDEEQTVFSVLAANGISAQPAYTNDFTLRRESVANALTRMIDGEPGLVIHPRCSVARKGMMGGYGFKRIQVNGQERFKDVPDKTPESHVCEAGQYMMIGAGEASVVMNRAPRRRERHREVRSGWVS